MVSQERFFQDAFIGKLNLIEIIFCAACVTQMKTWMVKPFNKPMLPVLVQTAYVRDVISKFGQRVKVYNLKKAIVITYPSPPSLMCTTPSRHSSQVYKKVPAQRNAMKLTVYANKTLLWLVLLTMNRTVPTQAH